MSLETLLQQRFAVSTADLEKARRFQADYGGRLESVLVNMGALSEEDITEALAIELGIRQITADDVYSDNMHLPSQQALERINLDFLFQRKWLPLSSNDADEWEFAAVDPLDLECNEYLQGSAQHYTVAICSSTLFRELEYRLKGQLLEQDDGAENLLSEGELERLREMASEAPTVALVNSLISRGIRKGASDLHLEPYQGMYRVRLRIDGQLHDLEYLPAKAQLPVASRLKILSGMDIAEKRRPQDGKISMKVASTELDIRVSATPLVEGESIVLRFLPKESRRFDLLGLGISADTLELIQQDLQRTTGVILLTGPTGSGKTTTLYSFLNQLNSEDVKIITLEDPVEYRLSGINQIQVNAEIGYDFASGLRSIVRQDPDIIMVGEIRDAETARIAIQSALTGHLVFSTVHTNNAPATYTRLLDLGVDEFLLNAGLVAIIAQRLVRRVCEHCAAPDPQAEAEIARYDLHSFCQQHQLPPPILKRGTGCERCAHSGYLGRIALIEYLRCDDELAALDKTGQFVPQAYQLLARRNARTLLQDGLHKVAQGLTTVEEVLREVG